MSGTETYGYQLVADIGQHRLHFVLYHAHNHAMMTGYLMLRVLNCGTVSVSKMSNSDSLNDC